MKSHDSHISDRELTMALDGELPLQEADRVHEHLASCWTCRSRKLDLERAIADFVHVYQDRPSQQSPPPAGPRALLTARLERMAKSKHAVWLLSDPRKMGWATAAGLCGLALAWVLTGHVVPTRGAATRAVMVPNPNLTPGAAVLVNRSELCMYVEPNNKEVPVALKRRVFEAYGLGQAETRAYEVDYLITPALGGADDIRNLWPHSYTNTEWNAKVKDALENQLREMVCEGRLDLATAQRELATNWIDAYKKYFHTDRPIGIAQ